MDHISSVLTYLANFLWGWPMLALLVGGGLYISINLGFFQIRYLPFILKQTFGQIFSKQEGEGTISPFQAATSALASSIGASNIVGVPVAIAMGGPGAVLWMWLTSIIGQATKFSEVVLGIRYREKNQDGEFVGGPAYYLRKGLKSPFLAVMCSFAFMIEIVPSISTQSLSICQTAETIGIPKLATGIVVTILVALIVFGGITRIGKVTEKLVPFMALIFTGCSLIVIGVNIVNVPHALVLIFQGAVTPMSAVGGFTGSAIAQTMRWGIARGLYSNEAGMGSAPYAHSAAITDHPVRQGFWGVFEVIVVTGIVCTMTALVVLTSGVWTQVKSEDAASMASVAFQSVFGETLGGGIVSICMLLFVLSTVIVIVFYCEKQAEALFNSTVGKVMRVVCLAAIIYGTIGDLSLLFSILDILLACVVFPNMIGVIGMNKEVKALKNEFFSDPQFYPAAKARRVPAFKPQEIHQPK
ncbi:amino acid carrier protein [Clostridium sp. W14A]|nr:amino acid carrier protein [Clostridium sp. W14A]